MGKNTKQLYFDYPDTSRIRFKKKNCLQCDEYPYVYRIKTDKLDFIVPRSAVILGTSEKHKKYVFVALSEYRIALSNFYKSIAA